MLKRLISCSKVKALKSNWKIFKRDVINGTSEYIPCRKSIINIEIHDKPDTSDLQMQFSNVTDSVIEPFSSRFTAIRVIWRKCRICKLFHVILEKINLEKLQWIVLNNSEMRLIYRIAELEAKACRVKSWTRKYLEKLIKEVKRMNI